MVKTDKHIMDITPEDLHANYRKKPCQVGCGVYCAVSTSLLIENPAKVVGKEIISRAKRVPALMRSAFTSRSNVLPSDARSPQHVNGSGDEAPPAKPHESVVSSTY